MSQHPEFDAELVRQIEALRKRLPCCPNCEYFTKKPGTLVEGCGLAPGYETPPPRIIAFGCSSFEAGIPF